MALQPRKILGNYTMADAMHVDARRACRSLLPVGSLYHYAQLVEGAPQPGGAHFNAQISYARCIDDGRRPAHHKGDWPVQDRWYPVRTVISLADGVPGVRIVGFVGEAPFYNAFSLDRFAFDGYHPFVSPN